MVPGTQRDRFLEPFPAVPGTFVVVVYKEEFKDFSLAIESCFSDLKRSHTKKIPIQVRVYKGTGIIYLSYLIYNAMH